MMQFPSKLPSSVVHIAALVSLNVLILLRVPFLSGLAGFIYLFLLPGFFLMESLRLEYELFWPRLLHVVALSVAFVLSGGLLTNTIVPLFGDSHPLAFGPVLFVFDLCLIAFGIFNYFFRKATINFTYLSISLKKLLPHISLGLFPIVAVMGATILNNGGSYVLTLVMIESVVILVLWLFFTKRDISESFWQSSIYFIALSLLLMASMRGWHIIGFDSHQEFRVFQLTKNDLFWTMSHLQDAYNACLSITILPTIMSQFIHLPDEYIFKFLNQIVFALMPIGVYTFARNFGDKKIAFLAAFFFMAQPWFFFGMPTLNRQGFGSLFFILTLSVLFSETIQERHKYQLATLYGMAMVVSHYSTTYIAVMLFLLTYGMNKCLSVYFHFKKDITREKSMTKYLSLRFILIIICSVFVWNTLITHTSNNFVEFLDHSSSNIGNVFSGDALTNSINQLLYPYPLRIDLVTYLKNTAVQFRENRFWLHYYSDQSLASQVIRPTSFQFVAPHFGLVINSLSATTFKLLKILVNNVFILVGLFAMLYYWIFRKFKSSEMIFFSLAGFILLALLLIIPGALREYNLERLYFQLLIGWSFVGVYGGVFILGFIKDVQYKYRILACIYCLLLLFFSGVIFNFTGGPAFIAVNNYGEDYEKNYTHDAEVASAKWLGEQHGKSLIYTSSPGVNKLAAFGNVNKENLVSDTLPTLVSKESYVYLTYMNTVGDKATANYNGDEYPYVYPTEFMDQNKDEIYSNGISKVYK